MVQITSKLILCICMLIYFLHFETYAFELHSISSNFKRWIRWTIKYITHYSSSYVAPLIGQVHITVGVAPCTPARSMLGLQHCYSPQSLQVDASYNLIIATDKILKFRHPLELSATSKEFKDSYTLVNSKSLLIQGWSDYMETNTIETNISFK